MFGLSIPLIKPKPKKEQQDELGPLQRLLMHPEQFRLEAAYEGDELIVRIKPSTAAKRYKINKKKIHSIMGKPNS